ncbi:MAG: hypothetical protein RIK87_09040 [Fuerstiella sp.]
MESKPSDKDEAAATDGIPVLSNTVALIGLILAVLAALLCVLLFILVERLPAEISVFQEELDGDRPAQLRLLILGCSTAVLAVVALILCVVGLFVQHRPRLLAAVGTTISLVLLLGIFGVLLVGSLMNPEPRPPEPQNPEITALGLTPNTAKSRQ